jgi:hypothetical protein
MLDGIDVPGSGRCRMAYDSRTGFFVLDGMIPEGLSFGDISYRSLLMPLSDTAQKQKALEVQVLFRTFFPSKHFQMERLVDGSSVRRAFIFERPPMLQQLYTDLGITPSEFVKAKTRIAAGLFQRNSATLRSKRGRRLTRRSRYEGGGLETPENVGQGTQTFIHEYLGSVFKKAWSRR